MTLVYSSDRFCGVEFGAVGAAASFRFPEGAVLKKDLSCSVALNVHFGGIGKSSLRSGEFTLSALSDGYRAHEAGMICDHRTSWPSSQCTREIAAALGMRFPVAGQC